MKRIEGVKQFLEAVGLVLLALYVVAHLRCALFGGADTTVQRAAGALNVEQYRKALDVCVDEGKDAGSMAVYSRCATEADKKYGASK
jgi:hypothetical protein